MKRSISKLFVKATKQATLDYMHISVAHVRRVGKSHSLLFPSLAPSHERHVWKIQFVLHFMYSFQQSSVGFYCILIFAREPITTKQTSQYRYSLLCALPANNRYPHTTHTNNKYFRTLLSLASPYHPRHRP